MIVKVPGDPGPPPKGWLDLPACPHPRTELRVQLRGAKRVRVAVRQCLDCGRNAGSVSRRGVGTDDLPPFDDAFREAKREEFRADVARLQAERKRAWWDWYGEYLQSPKWHALRARVLARDGGRCRVVGCGLPATQVHHLTYERVGAEKPEDVACVCDGCHQKLHPGKALGGG